MNTDPRAAQEAVEPPNPVRLLTITQAAAALQVGRCTMQRLVLQGDVRSFKINRLRRIPVEALDEYIQAHGSAA